MTTKKEKTSKKLRAINALGSTGYFFSVLQWLFVFILYFGWINTYFLKTMMPAAPEEQLIPPTAVQSSAGEVLSPIALIGIALFVIIMVAVTVYAFMKIPKMVAGAGNKVATVVTSQAAPIVARAKHIPNTKKNQLKLQGAILVYVKLAMISLPLIFAWTARFITEQVLSADVALFVGAVMVIPAVIFFSLQYLFGRVAKIPLKDLI